MKRTGLVARALLLGTMVLGTTASAAGVLADLWTYARAESSASHVVLIPFVSLALVLYRRTEIFREVRTGWVGGLALASAAVLLAAAARAAGPVAGSPFLLPVGALVTAWTGAFFLAFGPAASRAASFALAFLLLTIPMPPVLLDATTAFLKRGSAEVVSGLFTVTGTTFHRDAYVFSLPRVSIEIADQCSGIRSSLALGITALLAGHLSLGNAWSKALLLLAVLPIAVIKNGIRIATLAWLASDVNPAVLQGRLHTDGGVLFFLLSLALLTPVLTVLRQWEIRIPVAARSTSLSGWTRS